jgi:hypothetical protein
MTEAFWHGMNHIERLPRDATRMSRDSQKHACNARDKKRGTAYT